MPRSNIRLLTRDELMYFNSNYIFTLKSDLILVQVKNFNRITSHPINKDFHISTSVRKLKISKEAIEIWSEPSVQSKYTLVEIQNSINALILAYQKVDKNMILTQAKFIKDKYDKII